MPTREIADACSFLRDSIPSLLDLYNGRYEIDERKARVGEVLRTVAEQQAKYAQGRTTPGKIVTNADGVRNLSSHQVQTMHGEAASHAVDIDVLSLDGHIYVTTEQAYWPLIGLATAFRILSGGDWTKPDLPHLHCAYSK